MPCYEPLRAGLVETPQGRKIIFSEKEFNKYKDRKGLSLPCGRCIGCRLERSRQWAVRIMHESTLHDESCFLTLTYKDKPVNESVDVKTCQDFLKRLRSRISPKRIRHYMVGEYGDKMGRPHYHAVIFGYSFPDKKKCKQSVSMHGKVFDLYRSELLDEIWSHGACFIGTVTFDSASYISGYVTKKVVGRKSKEHYKGRTPEFSIMSRGGRKAGGIGNGWIKKYHSDVYPWDEVITNGKPARPPRYYDRYIENNDRDTYEVIRKKREEESEKLEEVVSRKTGEVYYQHKQLYRLGVRKEVAEAKHKLRKRRLEEG